MRYVKSANVNFGKLVTPTAGERTRSPAVGVTASQSLAKSREQKCSLVERVWCEYGAAVGPSMAGKKKWLVVLHLQSVMEFVEWKLVILYFLRPVENEYAAAFGASGAGRKLKPVPSGSRPETVVAGR